MISYEGRNRRTVNFLKTIYFDYPEWTICTVGLMPATWMKYRHDLEQLVLAHPRIFPGYKKGSKDFDAVDSPLYEQGRHTDCWGTVWENIERGLDSMTVEYPLQDWSKLDSYVPPDPLKQDLFAPRDWDKVKRSLEQAKARGDLAAASPLEHGFMYMRLFYLRGFENLMIDLATDDPVGLRYIDRRLEVLLEITARTLEAGERFVLPHTVSGVSPMAGGDRLLHLLAPTGAGRHRHHLCRQHLHRHPWSRRL